MRAWALLLLSGCIVTVEDLDGDGHIGAADCAPQDAAVYPGAPELCNGVDDDCDGDIDEDPDPSSAPTWYYDADGDGVGVDGGGDVACEAPAGHVEASGDCNDLDATVGADLTWYPDTDGDGWGDAEGVPVTSCDVQTGHTLVAGDCDDADARVHPGATETCDGVDDDCNGLVDDGALLEFYADVDEDGFGDPDSPVAACAVPAGAVDDATDCDDTDPAVFPGATRICNDGIDNACDAAAGLDPSAEACTDELATAARLLGTAEDEQLGLTVDAARGFYGAGGDALLVSAIGWADGTSGDRPGAAWVVPASALDLGTSSPYDGPIDQVGVSLVGARAGDQAASGMAAPGDMDGDGCDDLAVGAHLYDDGYNNVGAVFVVDGCTIAGMSSGSIDLGDHLVLTGGLTADWVGGRLAAIGDVNGDGLADLLASATGVANGTDGSAGAAVVLFGDEDRSPVSLVDLVDEGRGAVLRGPEGEAANLGLALAPGDFDGDGVTDLAAGAWKWSSETGGAFLVSGVDLVGDAPIADAASALLVGGGSNSSFGYAVSSMGDADGDGRDELVVSAPTDSTTAAFLGGLVLVYSVPTGGDLASWDGWGPGDAAGVVIGSQAWTRLGQRMAADGDVNGDGIHDVIVSGSPDATAHRGVAEVFLGPVEGTLDSTEARAHVLGDELFANHGRDVGFVGGPAGDALVIGAPQYDNDAGAVVEDGGAVFIVDGFGL